MASILPKKIWDWLNNQSDYVHSGLCVGGTVAALAPFLPVASPAQLTGLHLGALGVQVGTEFYVAFVSGPTMFVNMERTAFGNVQARLFPKYGMVGMSSGLAMLASYYLAHDRTLDNCVLLLGISTAVHFLNSFLVFPATTKLMFEKRKFEEGTEERKKADKKFGISHGISNMVNLTSLACNIAYVYVLANRITGHW